MNVLARMKLTARSRAWAIADGAQLGPRIGVLTFQNGSTVVGKEDPSGALVLYSLQAALELLHPRTRMLLKRYCNHTTTSE